MGFLDNFLNIMRLNPDGEEDFFDDSFYENDDIPEEKPARANFKVKKGREEDFEEDFTDDYKEKSARTTSKVTPIRPSKKGGNGSGNMEVCVFKPTSVEDEREITETLLQKRTVVLNVEGLDVEIAQRIIDFTSGATFALRGNLQKISNYIFIITPETVDISGDFLNVVDSFDKTGY